MDLDALFESYYTLYRAESQTPASTDDEYVIFTRFANDAIRRHARYDDTYWQEFFTNIIDAADGDKTITTSDTTYAAPTDFKEAGGFLKLRDSATNNVISRIPIVDVQDDQFRSDNAKFCYFTGNPADGYVLHLNVAPSAAESGAVLDYVYYKKPSELSSGTDKTEMKEPDFIVHHALSNRFRASRNWSAYQTAKRDAEDILKTMQLNNNSGTWANPWKVPDRSGSSWGQ